MNGVGSLGSVLIDNAFWPLCVVAAVFIGSWVSWQVPGSYYFLWMSVFACIILLRFCFVVCVLPLTALLYGFNCFDHLVSY